MASTEKTRTTVLVVEDDLDLSQIFTEIFEDADCEVLQARTGEQALKMLEVRGAQIIVSDMRLPAMDGLQFLEEVRKEEKNRGTRFLAVTGDPALAYEAKSKGADGILVKPFRMEALQKLLDDNLGS